MASKIEMPVAYLLPAAAHASGAPLPGMMPPPSSYLPVSRQLAAAPARLDAFLAHLHRCMQTPGGIDTVLQMVWASSRLAGILLARHAPQSSARDLVAAALGLPGRSRLLVAASATMPLAQRLKALAALIGEARAMMRLWGLLAMYLWGRRLVVSLVSPPPPAPAAGKAAAAAADEKPAWLSAPQLVASALFQLMDNSNLLSRHGVLGFSPAEQGAMARFGSRAWCVFLGSEMGRLAFELWRRDNGAGARSAEERAVVVKMQKSLVRNAAWAPIIFSGAVGGGLISEMTGAVLAMVPSVIMMKDLWRDTAAKSA